MSKIRRSIAALVLSLVGLVGCDHKPQAVEDVNPVRVATMQKTLRDLWLGHIFSGSAHRIVQHDDRSSRAGGRREQVVANANAIASTVTPFYGEAGYGKFLALLTDHYAAVKDYSEATMFRIITGRKLRLLASRTMLTS